MTANAQVDPWQFYAGVTAGLGVSHYARLDAPASSLERSKRGALTAVDVVPAALGGEAVSAILDHAPGNAEPLGGIKVMSQNCRFAARLSGTENIYKLYADTFGGEDTLEQVQRDGRALIESVFARK